MITLTNEDNMKLMKRYPDNYFELAIVDPPYGLGKVNFSTKKTHKEKKWNDEIPSPEYFKELLRVSNNQIIWGCNYYNNNIESKGRIVFDKKIPNHGMQNFSDCDLASQSFTNTIKLFKSEWRGNVQNGRMNIKNEEDIKNGMEKRIHPTQKPVKLYEWLLMNYAKEGDKILDTHLGSGSIALACHNLGFDLVGCELDKEYYNVTCERLKRHQAQLTMF